MNPLEAFLFGMLAGMALLWLVVLIASRRVLKRLEKQRSLCAALKAAGDNARAAMERGDRAAYEMCEAEFWGLSAELDHEFRDLKK